MENVKSELIFLNYQITEIGFKVNHQFVDQNVPIDIKYDKIGRASCWERV